MPVVAPYLMRFVQVVTAALPANQDHLDFYCKAQAEDNIYSKLIEYCTSGWPVRNKLSQDLKDFWRFERDSMVNLLLVAHSYCTNPG